METKIYFCNHHALRVTSVNQHDPEWNIWTEYSQRLDFAWSRENINHQASVTWLFQGESLARVCTSSAQLAAQLCNRWCHSSVTWGTDPLCTLVGRLTSCLTHRNSETLNCARPKQLEEITRALSFKETLFKALWKNPSLQTSCSARLKRSAETWNVNDLYTNHKGFMTLINAYQCWSRVLQPVALEPNTALWSHRCKALTKIKLTSLYTL